MTREEAREFISNLTTEEKDAVYRELWMNFVRNDVEARLEETPEDFEGYSAEDFKNLIENVAERYVYQGDYDCNLSYWQNIDELISSVHDQMYMHNNPDIERE